MADHLRLGVDGMAYEELPDLRWFRLHGGPWNGHHVRLYKVTPVIFMPAKSDRVLMPLEFSYLGTTRDEVLKYVFPNNDTDAPLWYEPLWQRMWKESIL